MSGGGGVSGGGDGGGGGGGFVALALRGGGRLGLALALLRAAALCALTGIALARPVASGKRYERRASNEPAASAASVTIRLDIVMKFIMHSFALQILCIEVCS